MTSKKRNDEEVDLFTPIVPRERWHPNFQRTLEQATERERQVLRSWATGFRDRDGKFVIEFQTTFNSSFWELYLFALWRDLRCAVDLSFARPDFVITGGVLGDLVAEAVVASNPSGGIPEWAGDLQAGLPSRPDMIDLSCLRLSQAITEKHRKWLSEYRYLPQCAGRPYVVCVAPFEQPFSSLQGTEGIDRLLFGGARPYIMEDGAGIPRLLGHAQTRESFKKSGSPVELGVFSDDRMASVSAVVFSALATWGKVHALSRPDAGTVVFHSVRIVEGRLVVDAVGDGNYRESLIDGAHIFVNPYAERPVDSDVWRRQGFCVHHFHPNGTRSDVPAGALVSRFAVRLGTRDEGAAAVEPRPAPPNAKQHVRSAPPEGVLFGGPNRIAGTDAIELMLYRGWTIWVGRDVEDDDWCSMGKEGLHLSVEEFRDASDENAFIGSVCRNREEALADARRRIDRILSGDVSDEDDSDE